MNRYAPFLLLLFAVQGLAQTTDLELSFTPEKWTFQEGKVEFLEYKGRKAVKLNETSGELFYKDLTFKDGAIEFDVEVDRPMPFPTIYFRVQDNNAEHVYLRTGAQKNAFDAVQYASIINGVNLWDLQHEFQSAADIRIGEWNHVKVVVSGKQLKVFVNDLSEPVLEIPCLEGNAGEGLIGIGTGFPGQVVFSGLIVKPDQTEGLSPLPGADLSRHDTRYIRNWQVTEPVPMEPGKEVNTSMLPAAETVWQPIDAERRALVNVSRKFGGSNGRRLVWLKASIRAEMDQTQLLKLGFSDEIWVFVNRQPVFLDKNLYAQNMRKSPNGRISLDNSSFHLHLNKGDNELLIALANDFYGWGLMARLEHLEGVELVR